MLHDPVEMAFESSTWKDKLESPRAMDMCVYNDTSSLEVCFCQLVKSLFQDRKWSLSPKHKDM